MNELNKLSPATFKETAIKRQQIIATASSAELPKTFPVNELAKRLHPDRQYMKVTKVTELCDATCYRLEPDIEKGTHECAVFKAGRYLNVFLTIEGMKVNRAYSISSSAKDARDGFYEITIKGVKDGLVSNYVLDHWKVGSSAEVSGPTGFFTYSSLRDAETVIGVAGGSGITPFLSMAKAIADNDEDFNLVLLYGSRDSSSILFKEDFDELQKRSDKIKVIHVLSDEEKEGYEHGFITAELISKYAPSDKPYSVFLCGPQAMYKFVDAQLETLHLPVKYIRHELFGEVHNPSQYADYPAAEETTVKITVKIRDESKTVSGSINASVMQILEKNGIAVPARCRSGECGFCHSLLISGKVYIPKSVDGRRLADFKYGYIHPCVSFPLSDLEIEVPADK